MRDGVIDKAYEVPDLCAVSQNAPSRVAMAGLAQEQSRAGLQAAGGTSHALDEDPAEFQLG